MTANAKVILAAADSIDETESPPRLLCYGLQHVLITVIGVSLLPVAGGWLGGGDPAAADFGSLVNLSLGLATITPIVVIQRFGRGPPLS